MRLPVGRVRPKFSQFTCPQCNHIIKLKTKVELRNDFHLYCPRCKCGMVWFEYKWTIVRSKTDIIKNIYK